MWWRKKKVLTELLEALETLTENIETLTDQVSELEEKIEKLEEKNREAIFKDDEISLVREEIRAHNKWTQDLLWNIVEKGALTPKPEKTGSSQLAEYLANKNRGEFSNKKHHANNSKPLPLPG